MTPARRWGVELRKAMKRRGLTEYALGKRLGAGNDTVGSWLRRDSLPTYEMALATAEALDRPDLALLIVELRTMTCERCGRDFITKKAPVARFCSMRCRSYRFEAKSNALKTAKLKERNGRMLAVYAETTDRMCRQWCPGGSEDHLCPDATCPIQEAKLCPWPVATGVLGRVA
jgi:transcriptional regulator with XRE-family HTH domain